MAQIFFEDFRPGDVTTFGALEVTERDIVAFAQDYDPQPFHLDAAAARASLLGGLAASGWHSAGLLMRMNCECWLNETAAFGAPGIEELSWLKPVRPGDRLSVRRAVLDARPLASRPGLGVVRFSFDLVNQAGETAMRQRNPILIGLRDGPAPEPGQYDRPPKDGATAAPPAPAPTAPPSAFPVVYEEMEPGRAASLGVWRATPEEIVAFARDYDPQPFHLSEASAAASPFGRLAASGWQTAAQWMRRMVDARAAAAAERQARGEPAPASGPSPGVADLKWARPVYAGDEVFYSSRCLDRRRTTRPGWGVASFLNQGVNQRGDLVLEFKASVFTPFASSS